jgi:hypothetical protein
MWKGDSDGCCCFRIVSLSFVCSVLLVWTKHPTHPQQNNNNHFCDPHDALVAHITDMTCRAEPRPTPCVGVLLRVLLNLHLVRTTAPSPIQPWVRCSWCARVCVCVCLFVCLLRVPCVRVRVRVSIPG